MEQRQPKRRTILDSVAAGLRRAWTGTRDFTREIWEGAGDMYREALYTNDVLQRSGWPPLSVSHGPSWRTVAATLRETAPDDQEQKVADILFDHYSKDNLDELVAAWQANPRLAARRVPLEQAVAAHRLGLFAASVPVLLAQCEGLIAEAFSIRYKATGQDINRLFRLLSSGPLDLPGDTTARIVWERDVRAQFTHGSPLPSRLSRHAIMHGADSEYGTREGSLKAILLFDYVQSKLRDPIIVADGVGHLPGCEGISVAKAELGFSRFRMLGPFSGAPYGTLCETCAPADYDDRAPGDATQISIPNAGDGV